MLHDPGAPSGEPDPPGQTLWDGKLYYPFDGRAVFLARCPAVTDQTRLERARGRRRFAEGGRPPLQTRVIRTEDRDDGRGAGHRHVGPIRWLAAAPADPAARSDSSRFPRPIRRRDGLSASRCPPTSGPPRSRSPRGGNRESPGATRGLAVHGPEHRAAVATADTTVRSGEFQLRAAWTALFVPPGPPTHGCFARIQHFRARVEPPRTRPATSRTRDEPRGCRATVNDLQVNIWGRRHPGQLGGAAGVDDVSVQYGLEALLSPFGNTRLYGDGAVPRLESEGRRPATSTANADPESPQRTGSGRVAGSPLSLGQHQQQPGPRSRRDRLGGDTARTSRSTRPTTRTRSRRGWPRSAARTTTRSRATLPRGTAFSTMDASLTGGRRHRPVDRHATRRRWSATSPRPRSTGAWSGNTPGRAFRAELRLAGVRRLATQRRHAGFARQFSSVSSSRSARPTTPAHAAVFCPPISQLLAQIFPQGVLRLHQAARGTSSSVQWLTRSLGPGGEPLGPDAELLHLSESPRSGERPSPLRRNSTMGGNPMLRCLHAPSTVALLLRGRECQLGAHVHDQCRATPARTDPATTPSRTRTTWRVVDNEELRDFFVFDLSGLPGRTETVLSVDAQPTTLRWASPTSPTPGLRIQPGRRRRRTTCGRSCLRRRSSRRPRSQIRRLHAISARRDFGTHLATSLADDVDRHRH